MRGKRPGFMKHLRATYRSGLEVTIAAALALSGIDGRYEQAVIPYLQPEMKRTYTPDFVLPNGIVVESKGILELDDRKKHMWVKEQHPALDIRFVFSNPSAKLYKGSPTTYAKWCDQRGFKYAKKDIPAEWLTERTDPLRLAAVETFLKG